MNITLNFVDEFLIVNPYTLREWTALLLSSETWQEIRIYQVRESFDIATYWHVCYDDGLQSGGKTYGNLSFVIRSLYHDAAFAGKLTALSREDLACEFPHVSEFQKKT